MFDFTQEKKIIENNFLEAFKGFSNFIESDHGVTFITSSIPFPFFNSVIQTHVNDLQIEETIEKIRHFYTSKNIPFCWFITDLSEPASFAQRLEVNKFKPIPSFEGMILDIQKYFPDNPYLKDIRIEKVNSLALLEQWAKPIQTTFFFHEEVMTPFIKNMEQQMLQEKVIHYMAYYQDEHAGSATAFLGSESMGLYNLAVYPSFQQKGIGKSLQYQRLLLAKELGYQYLVLQAHAYSKKAAQSLGFKGIMQFVPYLYQP